MKPQLFHSGDKVSVRPYAEIDRTDIGNARYEESSLRNDGKRYCYGIDDDYIDKLSSMDEPLIVHRESDRTVDRDMFIYELRTASGGQVPYWWAQGMLRPYEEAEPMPEPDVDGLFGLLFGT